MLPCLVNKGASWGAMNIKECLPGNEKRGINEREEKDISHRYKGKIDEREKEHNKQEFNKKNDRPTDWQAIRCAS